MLPKHLFVIKKLRLIGSTSFGCAQNFLHDFQTTLLNSYWHCFRQMPGKCTNKNLSNPVKMHSPEVRVFAESIDPCQPTRSRQAYVGTRQFTDTIVPRHYISRRFPTELDTVPRHVWRQFTTLCYNVLKKIPV